MLKDVFTVKGKMWKNFVVNEFGETFHILNSFILTGYVYYGFFQLKELVENKYICIRSVILEHKQVE